MLSLLLATALLNPAPPPDPGQQPRPQRYDSRALLRVEPAYFDVAAATGGFLLGVATFLLVKVLRRPQPARLRLGSARKRGKKVDVAASRSFLVDVHLLKDR